MQAQPPSTGSAFGALDELSELSRADRFVDWIADTFDPVVSGTVLDVGAGFGAVAVRLATRRPDVEVTALEPAANVYDELAARCEQVPNLVAAHATARDLIRRIETGDRCTPLEGEPSGDGHAGDGHAGDRRFDTVLYVNVLEHIADDRAELVAAARLLRPTGHLGILVPAMPSLYGSLDHKSGHHRRYTREGLRSVVEGAGFTDVDVRYLDPVGIVPYWLMYRVLGVSRLGRRSTAVYDRLIVPLSRASHRLVARPGRGKNLVATARRPPGPPGGPSRTSTEPGRDAAGHRPDR